MCRISERRKNWLRETKTAKGEKELPLVAALYPQQAHIPHRHAIAKCHRLGVYIQLVSVCHSFEN
jgi:hypothetical protein